MSWLSKINTRSFTCTLLCTVVLSFAFVANPANAATGDVQISVISGDSRPLSGARIELASRDGETQELVSDATGTASATGLETGFYRVTVTLEGFAAVVEPSLRIIRDKTVPLEFVLRSEDQALDEIVVVATATRRDTFGSVTSSYLAREDLRTAPGSGADVLRALDGLPGLMSTGAFANFTVRGRGPRDNLILVDGFPNDKVVHFDESLGEQEDINGGGRFSIFPPNIIAGGEYSPGGWGAAYGGRNGSLLKLDIAKGNPSPTASLRLDLAGLEAIYDGPSGIHDDTSLIFTARQFDFGRLFEIIEEEDIGEPVMTDVILKTHTSINDNNDLEFLFLYTPETYDRDVSHVLASEDFEDRELLNNEADSTLVGFNWTRLFGDDGQWENRFYYREFDKTSRQGEAFYDSDPMDLPEDEVPVREEIITLEEMETEIGWRSDVSLTNRFGQFTTGLRIAELDLDFTTTLDDDWIRYEFDTDDLRPDPSQKYIVLMPALTNSAFARKEMQYAVYAEQLFNIGEWDIRGGLRYDYDGFSDKGYVSPRFAANYRLSAVTRLSATAGTFFQSPRFLDRAADPSNFGLENERTDHFSVGVERSFGQTSNVLVELYYQQLSDLVTTPDRVSGRATNGGEGESWGVDVVVNSYFSDQLSVNAVYSYNNATLDDNDGNGEYDADFNHEHLFSIGARWEINERWQVGFRWKYATGRPRDDFIVHDDVLADIGGPLRYSREFITNNTLRWDDFHTLNARVDYRRPLGPVDFVAFLDILNVYGAATSDEREFNPITGEFVEEDGESVPLIGIKFEKTW